MRREFPYLSSEQQDEIVTDAAMYLWQQLLRRTYNHPVWNDDHFTNHYYTIIKRQMYWSVNEVAEFTYTPPETDIPRSPKPIHPWDVEQHIYLEQLPGEVRDLVTKKIRFKDQELQACLYVLDRVLTGSKIVPAYMKNELNVRDPQFLVTYMVVVLRNTLYEMKVQGRQCFANVFDTRYSY